MINITCGLTVKKPGSAPRPTLIVIDYGTTFFIFAWPYNSPAAFRQMVISYWSTV